jgi:hypothetical protein
MPQDVTSGAGRIVFGSIYDKQTTDAEGKPVPEDKQRYTVGVAFEKIPGKHWAEVPYLAPIWAEAHAAFPNGETQRPDFSWKVQDGDSTIPNKAGKKNCEKEGFPGHWVVTFSTMLPINAYNAIEKRDMLPNERIKAGDYVQVYFSVSGNNITKKSQTDGMYLNPMHVGLVGYGKPISSAPPVSAANFGGVALPAGASTTPMAASAPTGTPPPPSAPAAPAAVTPNTAILNAPAAPPPPGAAPAAPPPPPAAPAGPVMGPNANGIPYEEYVKQGWSDDQMRQGGIIQ